MGVIHPTPDLLRGPCEGHEFPAQLGDVPGVLPRLHRRSDVLGTAPQLEEPVGEVFGGRPRQDQCVSRHRRPGEVPALLIGALAAGLAAVPTTTPTSGLYDLPAAPGAVLCVLGTTVGTLGNMG